MLEQFYVSVMMKEIQPNNHRNKNNHSLIFFLSKKGSGNMILSLLQHSRSVNKQWNWSLNAWIVPLSWQRTVIGAFRPKINWGCSASKNQTPSQFTTVLKYSLNPLFAWSHTSSSIRKISSTEYNWERKHWFHRVATSWIRWLLQLDEINVFIELQQAESADCCYSA